MRDVAKLAAVSPMTVSRVLKGTVFVAEETRIRVQSAVEQLNYVPNEIARSLREQRTRQIGIIVPNLHDPFFAICAHAISLVAKQNSYSCVISTSDENPATEYIEAKRMLLRHMEGILIVPTHGKSKLLNPEFTRMPIVAFDRPIRGSSYSSVVVENKLGACVGVQHLIDHGHRRIAYLGLAHDVWTLGERWNGYKLAIRKAHLKQETVEVPISEEATYAAVEQMLTRKLPPTACFCSNNYTMRATLQALSKLNVSIPNQFAVVGFDDFEMADIVKPPVTVVRQPTEAVGRVAAELLFDQINARGKKYKPRQVVLPVELIVRDSCGIHPKKS